VGAAGIIVGGGKELRVANTFISPTGVILHQIDPWQELKEKTPVRVSIDVSRRKATEANHTATHLLHKALREILGVHVKQAGSYVGPDKLRFDFTHFHHLSQEELQKAEQLVNQKIKEKIKVEVLRKSYAEALKLGATALFGEKYGEQVRVLKIGTYSLELCGGTHVKSTSEIVFFKIIAEGALGSGLRRIEALAGQPAKIYVIFKAKSLRDEILGLIGHYRRLQVEKENLGGTKTLETNIFEIEVTELESLSRAVDNHDSASVYKFLDHLLGRVNWLKERVAKEERQIELLLAGKVKNEAIALASEVTEIASRKILLKEFREYDMNRLRTISDTLQGQLKSCLLLLVSTFPQKFIYLITATSDLAAGGISARRVAEVFSGVVGGKAGGKDTKAEGGGGSRQRIPEGFEAVRKMLQ
jgi:alanyl-tRNA synthetase